MGAVKLGGTEMFENRLREHREKAGLSQTQLARRVSIAESNYCKIENGLWPAWPKARRDLARQLKVRIPELFPNEVEGRGGN